MYVFAIRINLVTHENCVWVTLRFLIYLQTYITWIFLPFSLCGSGNEGSWSFYSGMQMTYWTRERSTRSYVFVFVSPWRCNVGHNRLSTLPHPRWGCITHVMQVVYHQHNWLPRVWRVSLYRMQWKMIR